jgi:hypothetical protein
MRRPAGRSVEVEAVEEELNDLEGVKFASLSS